MSNAYYDENTVSAFAAVSLEFFEWLEFNHGIEYGEDCELEDAQIDTILQQAMLALGYEKLDMNKLQKSYNHYYGEVDFEANPHYQVDLKQLDFEAYLKSVQ